MLSVACCVAMAGNKKKKSFPIKVVHTYDRPKDHCSGAVSAAAAAAASESSSSSSSSARRFVRKLTGRKKPASNATSDKALAASAVPVAKSVTFDMNSTKHYWDTRERDEESASAAWCCILDACPDTDHDDIEAPVVLSQQAREQETPNSAIEVAVTSEKTKSASAVNSSAKKSKKKRAWIAPIVVISRKRSKDQKENAEAQARESKQSLSEAKAEKTKKQQKWGRKNKTTKKSKSETANVAPSQDTRRDAGRPLHAAPATGASCGDLLASSSDKDSRWNSAAPASQNRNEQANGSENGREAKQSTATKAAKKKKKAKMRVASRTSASTMAVPNRNVSLLSAPTTLAEQGRWVPRLRKKSPAKPAPVVRPITATAVPRSSPKSDAAAVKTSLNAATRTQVIRARRTAPIIVAVAAGGGTVVTAASIRQRKVMKQQAKIKVRQDKKRDAEPEAEPGSTAASAPESPSASSASVPLPTADPSPEIEVLQQSMLTTDIVSSTGEIISSVSGCGSVEPNADGSVGGNSCASSAQTCGATSAMQESLAKSQDGGSTSHGTASTYSSSSSSSSSATSDESSEEDSVQDVNAGIFGGARSIGDLFTLMKLGLTPESASVSVPASDSTSTSQ